MTDIQFLSPVPWRRGTCAVVHLQQRFMGLPVYGGRRAVRLWGASVATTGRWIAIMGSPARSPRVRAVEAVAKALGRLRPDAPEVVELCSFACAEQFKVFQAEGFRTVSTHLTVFRKQTGKKSRLAWVVDVSSDEGLRYELVVDALTAAVLHSSGELGQSIDGCLTLASPPPAPAEQVRVPVEPWWRTSAAVRVEYGNRRWVAATAPSFCNATPREARSINAFILANLAFDWLGPSFPDRDLTARLELFGTIAESEENAARTDGTNVKLKSFRRDDGRTHNAALDPTVVLHEVAHAAMNQTVGGQGHPQPLQGDGRAVAEGLADYFGLTLWNALCRQLGRAEEGVVGQRFLSKPRDFASYLDGGGEPWEVRPRDPHLAGQDLCGALLQARFVLIDEGNLAEEQADALLWRALCGALTLLPTEGAAGFCCVRRLVLENLPAGAGGLVRDGLDDVIPNDQPCRHW